MHLCKVLSYHVRISACKVACPVTLEWLTAAILNVPLGSNATINPFTGQNKTLSPPKNVHYCIIMSLVSSSALSLTVHVHKLPRDFVKIQVDWQVRGSKLESAFSVSSQIMPASEILVKRKPEMFMY